MKNKLRARQRGQATFEYFCVISSCVIILILPLDDGESPIVRLANALKGFYNAFAFALSFSSTITPL
jgi:hypothetical protein